MKSHADNEPGKEAYEKPQLRVISLTAEEVLAVGCKVTETDPSGVAGNGCLTGVCSATLGS